MKKGDWLRSHEARYFSGESDPEAFDAAQHVLMARSALRMGRREIALQMYRAALKMWHDLENGEPGMWEEELQGTNEEFAGVLMDRASPAGHA
jgi:hypothetical protein